jgi:ABC-2 type transport system permease protein
MSKYLTTLKYSLINSFAINKLRRKDNPAKFSILKIFLLIFLAIFIMGVSFLYARIFGDMFNQVNMAEYILSLGIFFGVLMSFLMTVTNATGFLFRSKDFNLLMSLPIKQNTVVLSKLSYLLIINYVIFAYIYIPTLIVYAIYVPTTFIFWVLAIITFILGPFFPVVVSVILAYFLSIIIPKFKYKNLLSILFSIGLIVLIMILSFLSSMSAEDPTKFTNSITNFLGKTGEWAFNGMRGDFLEYLFFVLVSILPFILLVYIIGSLYLKANTKFNAASSKSNYKMEELEVQSQSITLIKKEVRRYFNSPMYVLNTIVGPILSTVMLVMVRISIKNVLSDIPGTFDDLSFMAPIIVALIIFMLGITSTTAAGLSIEGKQFWILKSSPLTAIQVFNGKIFVNLLITIPFVVVNTILGIFLFDFEIVDYLMIFLIPALFSIFMSYLGLYVNLLFPRFDYENDVKAVKQSLSVIITMGVGFAVAILAIALGAVTIIFLEKIILGYLVGLVICLVFAITLVLLLYKHGTKLYKKIVI